MARAARPVVLLIRPHHDDAPAQPVHVEVHVSNGLPGYPRCVRRQVTVNLALLVAVPAGTVTVIRPLVAPVGTVVTI